MTSALCWCTALALASPRSVTAFMSLPSHPHPSLELARPHSSSWHPAAKAREAAVAHRRCTNGSRRQICASCMMVGAVPSLGAGLAGALLKGGLGVAVGFVLGLLGGGGSILALPIFLEVFHEPSATAIAESLLVVAVGAGVGLLAKLDSVNISQLVPLATMAMVGSAAMARIAPGIPDIIRLGIFCIFAVYSAVSMLRSVQSPAQPSSAGFPPAKGRPSPQKARVAATAAASMTTTSTVTLYALLIGVGALTSIIGAGGGFVIVPVLTGFAAMEVHCPAQAPYPPNYAQPVLAWR